MFWIVEGRAWVEDDSFQGMCLKMASWFERLAARGHSGPDYDAPFVRGVVTVEPHPLAAQGDTLEEMDAKRDAFIANLKEAFPDIPVKED